MIKYVLNFRSPPIFSSSNPDKRFFSHYRPMHWLQVIIRRLQSVALHSKDWIKQGEAWMKDKHSFSLIWNNFVVVGLVLWLVLFRFHSSNEISLKSTFYAGERTDLSKLYKKLLAPPSCQKSNMSKWFGPGYSLQIKFLYWRII